MTISVQLDAQLTRKLERAAAVQGVSKSEWVRRCLKEHLPSSESASSPWELGKHVFGRFGSGQRDLARNRKRILREKISAKV